MENNRNRQPNVKERTLINRIKRHFKRYGGISIVDFPHYEDNLSSIPTNLPRKSTRDSR